MLKRPAASPQKHVTAVVSPAFGPVLGPVLAPVLAPAIGPVMVAISIAALALLSLMATPARADVWKLDPQHTEIRFTWDHLGLSRQSGEMREVYGRLQFAPTNPTAGEVEITMLLSGLSTGVTALDTMLRSFDYFYAKQYPRITFRSTTVVPTGDKTGQLTGDLTIRGVTRPVVLDVVWNFTGEHPLAPYNPVHRGVWVTGFTASATLNRSAWGITQAAPLISDKIMIEINAEFTRVD